MHLAQHDTYRSIENYARHPQSAAALLQFRLATAHEDHRAAWTALTVGKGENYELLKNAYLGCR